MISSQDGTEERLPRPLAALRPPCAAGARSASGPASASWGAGGCLGSWSGACSASCGRSADGACSGCLGGASAGRRAGRAAWTAAGPNLGWSGVTVAAPRPPADSAGRSASGSDSLAASSSAGVACLRRGSYTHSAVRSRPPELNTSWTCQLPSARLVESHCTSSALVPSALSRSVTTSPSLGPGPESPGRRTMADCASCARYARSASTGPSNQRTRSIGTPAASAISSAVSPARIRSWISLGRKGLSTSISYWASRENCPRATALSRSSICSEKRPPRPGTTRTA